MHFSSLLEVLPTVPKHVDPTSHHHIINDWSETAAAHAIPREKGNYRNIYVPKYIFQIIRDCNHSSKQRLWIGAAIRNATIRTCFKVWGQKIGIRIDGPLAVNITNLCLKTWKRLKQRLGSRRLLGWSTSVAKSRELLNLATTFS